MKGITTEIQGLLENPSGTRYSDLTKVCDHFFGPPRQQRSSHAVYRTPWPGNPRVNIQRKRDGMAKAYQVRQVVKALKKLAEVDST